MNAMEPTSSRHDLQPSGNSKHDPLKPWDDMVTYLREYAREEPEVAALVCLGVGFILI